MSIAQEHLDDFQDNYLHLEAASCGDDYFNLNTTIPADTDNEYLESGAVERGFSIETHADEIFPLSLFTLSGENCPDNGWYMYLTEEYLASIESLNEPLSWLLGMTKQDDSDTTTIYEDYLTIIANESNIVPIPEAFGEELETSKSYTNQLPTGHCLTINRYDDDKTVGCVLSYPDPKTGLQRTDSIAIARGEPVHGDNIKGYLKYILVEHFDLPAAVEQPFEQLIDTIVI